jgi:uncharacterized protein
MYVNRVIYCLLLAISLSLVTACQKDSVSSRKGPILSPQGDAQHSTPIDSPLLRRVVEAGIEQTHYTFSYDPSYVKLDYPGGDVPLEKGVCSDVIVRAFRKGGIDLQQELHEDMKRNFSAYPQKWGLTKPDANIDHRRVPNLMTYFERKGKRLAISTNPKEYLPGDVVTWDLGGGGVTHIGLVTNIMSDRTSNYLIVHNIGAGARIEDVLFSWQITGHYRYFEWR